MTRINALENENRELQARIETAIRDGDLTLYEKLKRAETELETKSYFARTQQLKESLASLQDERSIALDLMRDFDSELKQQAAVVIEKRGELMDAEAGYNLTKARQFALEGQLESFRVAINEAKNKLNLHVAALVNPFGSDEADNGNTAADVPAVIDVLEQQTFICD